MSAKVLQVAVTQNQKILEQKLISDRSAVTFGKAGSATFTLPSDALGASFTLFEVVSGKYCLNFTDKMTGKVRIGDGELDFATARQQTGVRKSDTEYQMVLTASHKGFIELGDGLRVIFSFVDAPAKAPKTALASENYQTPIERFQNFFMYALLASFVLHSVLVYAMKITPPPKVTVTAVPDRFAQVMQINNKKPVKPPKETKKKEKKKPSKDAKGKTDPNKKKAPSKKADKKAAPKKRVKVSAAKRAAQRDQAKQRVQQSRALKAIMIGTRGEGGAGVTFAADNINTDVVGALNKAGGQGIGVSDGLPGGAGGARAGSGGGGPVGIGDVQGVEVSGNAGKLQKRKQIKIRIKMKMAQPEMDDGELDAKKVGNRIRRRKRAFQACYERELKRSSDLAGKVLLEVTVGSNGRVNSVEILENDLNASVGNCVRSKMRSIRFPKPEGGDEAIFTYPFVFSKG